MATAELPHAYPFRFVDSVEEPRDAAFSRGRVRARVSANGRAAMGEAWASPLLYAEAIAQAALLLEGGDPELARNGFLAGIEGFTAERLPLAGETLEIAVKLAARFGAIVRFDGEVTSGSEVVARGSVLVRQGGDERGGPV
jgi:3-hydroxymyristoyl/3-hydroxydecanoyl-(acyl carrier protein) dehydratase